MEENRGQTRWAFQDEDKSGSLELPLIINYTTMVMTKTFGVLEVTS